MWLRRRLDQSVIGAREAPLEVHYESLNTYYDIYEQYLILRSIKKNILSIYIFELLLVKFRFIEKLKEVYRSAC